jgi:putative serine protease PepD
VKRIFLSMMAAALVGAVVASMFFILSGGSSRSAVTRKFATPATRSAGAGSSGAVTKDVASTTPSATQVYQRDAAGVVSIKVVDADGGDSGTGIVLNDEGLILTNNHVISEYTSITVSPGKSATVSRAASVVGTDPNSDLALIKVNPTGMGLQPLKLASSSSVQVGDPVYALGNPYGLNETLTKGIVSALEREISAPDGAAIKNVIQTDAPLNPGNSGGPLLNAEGDVIGVNSQIASDAARTEGSQPGSTGVGFAISSNTVAEVIKTIESGGGNDTRGTESEAGAQPSGTESSPYAATSPRQTEEPAEAQGDNGESREAGPRDYESNHGAEVEGAGEIGASGTGSAGVESDREGHEGQVVIMP